MRRLKSYVRNLATKLSRDFVAEALANPELKRHLDMSVERHWRLKALNSPNPLLRQGEKFYSQNDEDGIINAILTRLGMEKGVFVEFGCGDGLENNTLQLLMRGWRGIWIGAEDLRVTVPESSKRLRFERGWVTRENCAGIMQRGLRSLGTDAANLISMDLDGNDLYCVKAILDDGFKPDVFIVEYNGKLPPPIRFAIDYDPAYVWSGSDYSGASLQSFIDLFDSFGFRLVCCNVTGANAFFVPMRHSQLFDDVPTDATELFMPADYNWFVKRGHTTDPRSIERFLRDDLAEASGPGGALGESARVRAHLQSPER